jgi:hypothetical protein
MMRRSGAYARIALSKSVFQRWNYFSAVPAHFGSAGLGLFAEV